MGGARSKELLDDWRVRFDAPVSGWNFTEFADEVSEESPPWSYNTEARRVLRGARHVLDMGTGGGEVLAGLADALPEDTLATEGWPPNVPVASAALADIGVKVVAYDAESDAVMPFETARFDLILNRHEAYDAAEIRRTLTPGGRFLTQQVDGRNFKETQALFGATPAYPHVTLSNFRSDIESAGLTVERTEDWTGMLRFSNVGALVRYFAIVPWEAPDDFSVDRYADVLLDLHDASTRLEFTQRRFLLIART